MKYNKVIYVDGGVVITTPFFRYQDGGALWQEQPIGTELMPCNHQIDGMKVLIIGKKSTPSMFNKYYAKDGFSSKCTWAYYFHKDYEDDYEEYMVRINEAKELINNISNIAPNVHNIIMRQAFLSVIAALDTFVCDTILTKITQDKDAFSKYFDNFYLKKITSREDRQKKRDELDKMWVDNNFGETEQEVISNVLDDSYCNVNNITSIYKELFGITICDTSGKIGQHFEYRHRIVHRNGRNKDSGEFDDITTDAINELISDINGFVEQIMKKL